MPRPAVRGVLWSVVAVLALSAAFAETPPAVGVQPSVAADIPPSAPQPLTARDVKARLAEITPSFPAPYAQAVLPVGVEPGAVRLLGVDLAQAGPVAASKRPRLEGGRPLTLTAYWVPSTRIVGRIPFSLRFWLENFMVSRGEDLAVGPGPGQPPWEPGVVQRQEYSVNLSNVSSMLTGNARLSLQLTPKSGAGQPGLVLQEMPVFLAPQVGRGRIRAELWEPLLAGPAKTLSVSFRLCNEARVRVPVRVEPGRAATTLLVASAYAYGSLPQDTPVMEVTVEGREGARVVVLRSGVDTARTDYDFFPPGAQDHAKATIIDSQDADYLDSGGAPFQRHRYLARLALDPPVAEPRSVSFRLLADVVVDVHEAALLFGGADAP